MISGVLVFNANAELVISRFYKSDYSRVAAEAFRVKVVAAKNFNSPVIVRLCLLIYMYQLGKTNKTLFKMTKKKKQNNKTTKQQRK